MTLWDCKFSARPIGSLGVWRNYHFAVEAPTAERALEILYDHYEHIGGRVIEHDPANPSKALRLVAKPRHEGEP